MSSPSPTRDIEPEDEQVFSTFLTVYLKVKKLLWGKSTLKEEKLVKIKEFFFVIKLSNLGYIDFLKSMLQKHGQEDYEVTKKSTTHFDILYPKWKGTFMYFLVIQLEWLANGNSRQWVANAIDVDNLADYEEMVTKIIEGKPSAIKILVDMQNIQKLPRV